MIKPPPKCLTYLKSPIRVAIHLFRYTHIETRQEIQRENPCAEMLHKGLRECKSISDFHLSNGLDESE